MLTMPRSPTRTGTPPRAITMTRAMSAMLWNRPTLRTTCFSYPCAM